MIAYSDPKAHIILDLAIHSGFLFSQFQWSLNGVSCTVSGQSGYFIVTQYRMGKRLRFSSIACTRVLAVEA